MKTIFLSFLFCIVLITNAQIPEIALDRQYFKDLKKHGLNNKNAGDLYVHDRDTTGLFYYAIAPKQPLKGMLILLPGTWELAEMVLNNNAKLIGLAHDRGIMTVVPSLNYNLCLGETALDFLNATFADTFEKYKPPVNKIIIGGFSLGGMNALRYTEMAFESEKKTAFKPAGVYGVDPPVELSNLYYTFQRTVENNAAPAAIGEASSYLARMESQFGGSPVKSPDKYSYCTMYSRKEPMGGNARFLRNVPVRIYSDPDIDWHLKNRKADYYDMNALDQSAMINALHKQGNEQAEFVNALGKGIRLNGTRHPHSWSIVDPAECITWIEKCIAGK
jgi:hypothetical protein